MTVTGTVGAGAAGNAAHAKPVAERFELGEWRVDPAANRLTHATEGEQALEPRAMAVLLALCASPGEVISADTLLVRCWGDALVEGGLGDNPVHKSINQLRRALGDSATAPRYIETIRKRGYRVIAPVRGGQGQARSGAWQGGSPFRGLQAFDIRHAEVFFGREQATQELLRSVTAQMQRQHGLVLVLGPSGSGKTSLVSAGLIPTLQREPLAGRWQLISYSQLDLADLSVQASEAADGTASPPAFALALAAALLDWETPAGEPLLAGFNAHDLARALSETPATVLTELRAALLRQGGSGQPYALLFIDRLEALFRPPLGDEALREPALRLLQQLAESGSVLLVAACRNDYYPQLAQHPWLMRDKAQGGHLDLAPPSRAEIAQMVRLPARAAGLSFGIDASTHQRLDDLLCDAAAASPDALPLLQYTLEQLYQQRSAHGELTFAAYQALGGASGGMGGLEGVIAEQAEQLIRAMTPVQQEALPHVLALLVLVGEDESSPVGGRRALWSELRSAAERELVRALVDARLLVSEHSTEFAREEPGFRVAHEALLRRWPRVTDWIAQHRQDLQTRARLRQQVQRWEQGGRAAEFLWPRGRQLQDAWRLRESEVHALSPTEGRFLAASMGRAVAVQRLKHFAIAVLLTLTVLSGLLALKAFRAERDATEKKATSDRLLSFMLGEMAEQLRPVGRLSLIERIGTEAMGVLQTSALANEAPSARIQRARALLILGEVYWEKKQTDSARKAFDVALELCRGVDAGALARDERGNYYKTLGAAEYWVAQLNLSTGEREKAKEGFSNYLSASRQGLALAPQDQSAQLEVSYSLNALGSLALRDLDIPLARQLFAERLSITRQILRATPDDYLRQLDLANVLEWTAEVCLVERGDASCWPDLDEMTQLLEQAAASRPQDMRVQMRLASAYAWRALLHEQLGHYEKGLEVIRKALAMARRTAMADADNQEWKRRVVVFSSMEAVLRSRLPKSQGPGREPIDLATLQTHVQQYGEAVQALRYEYMIVAYASGQGVDLHRAAERIEIKRGLWRIKDFYRLAELDSLSLRWTRDHDPLAGKRMCSEMKEYWGRLSKDGLQLAGRFVDSMGPLCGE